MCNFRNLTAEEIDVRVSQIFDNGFTLLLYKDARCDMNILDETVGNMNWQRMHTRDNANCIVSIWDKEKGQWISKEDTGTESNTEKEKGLASDSFKRACFNWGIGRELYTAPFIWVKDTNYIKKSNKTGKNIVNERFKVVSIEISKDKVITALEIADSKNNIVFSTKKKNIKQEQKEETPKQEQAPITEEQIKTLKELGYKGSKPLESMTSAEAKMLIVMGQKKKIEKKFSKGGK